MESLKTALVANLGTTPEPILKALEVTAEGGEFTLFLAYGKKIQDQERPPVIMAEKINERAKQLGITCHMFELDFPEKFEDCFAFYERLIDDVNHNNPERVIIDITGGTKVMSAALIHATLTWQWGVEVIFEYVGGSRDTNGRVKNMELIRDDRTVTHERMQLVLEAIRQQEFTRAVILADYLPGHGNARFVKDAADIFWKWDNFHYDEAKKPLVDMGTLAKTLVSDTQLRKIADTILRLQKESSKIILAMSALRKLKESGEVVLTDDILEGWISILGDTIANTRRRAESDPIDCVLRCYRAVEVTSQIAQVKLGMNPWKPNWDTLNKAQLVAYCEKIRSTQPPNKISLDSGIKLIEILTSALDVEIIKNIRDIEITRNQSYLEHGYNRILKHTAIRMMEKMEIVVPILLNNAGIKDNPFAVANGLTIEA